MIPFRTPEDVARAIPAVQAHLAADRLLAYPTETVYGLGCAPTDAALDRLATLKGRPARKPFLLLVSGLEMLNQCGLVLTPSAKAMAQEFWPGPLTLVLSGGEGRLPDRLRGGGGGIAVRWTSHDGIARLIEACGRPLTSTSANLPGGPTAPGPGAIASLFPDAMATHELMVLDGGVLGNVPPSTLVDCTTAVPALVRAGAIPIAELRRRVGRLAP
ncbi:MAG: L-threonylcarbamoyladenylate synthase [Gemmatimonadetes bacterium]|jgi:L-threonylcarbamoyladenylate synthase|nr:L-threonylcarbamoyladenylate synthase [Gemmatimonadota bacterium]MBK9547614.1 L-threonylcarbamoyladenylate synthase [Gemmatimonadota bacterium]MBP7621068.1 L-threonylcarbamoyladenylate synthase [Gemmatimonadales bacterium]MBP9898484.1 L-threonylcarbamoyladenylate synthase [Gemmatimonadales bacterium]